MGFVVAFWPPSIGSAHLIDEVADSIVIDLESADRRDFGLTYVVHAATVEAFYRQAREAGMDVRQGDQDFARRLAKAFRYDGCRAEPLAADKVRVELPQKGFIAWRLRLRCEQVRDALRLHRVDFDRRKTRTTLYVSIRVAGRAPSRTLVPPRLAQMSLPLLAAAAPLPSPRPTPRRGAKGPAGHERGPAQAGAPGRLPTDPVDLSKLPLPGAPTPSTWQRALRPPPGEILLAWAQEGAHHLVGGADHLLFLAALALAALAWRALLFAVLAFSVGHMLSMALTLLLDWQAATVVEVAIAASICWSGWRARRPTHAGAGWTIAGAGVFGIVHGVGFGAGLKALVGGAEGILWPIVSFGLGLDLAQSAWAIGLMMVWTPVRRKWAAGQEAGWPARLQTGAAWALIAAGLALAVVAARA